MVFSPVNQESHSDDADNDWGSSATFDHANILGNSRNMRFFDVEVEDGMEDVEDYDNNAIHDQLPSVEDAKLYNARNKNQGRIKSYRKASFLWASVFVVVLLVAGVLSGKRHQHQKAVISVTKTIRVSHIDSFHDFASPQSRALRWMMYEDSLKLPLPVDRNDPFVQRYALAVLFFSLTDKLVHKDVRETYNLLSDVHECTWNRNDHAEDIILGVLCGQNGSPSDRVTDILFPMANLRGTIPAEIEALNHLSNVNLSNNRVQGNIPPMPFLTNLDLTYNEFTGYLPDHFSEMTRLKVLRLSENGFQGSLPHKFAALTDLEILALSGNQLTGGVDKIYSLSKLSEVYLSNNSFEDQLSNRSFKNLSDLKVIDMKYNRFSGPLPDALWKLTNLEVIDFHKNSLDGHINNVIVENHPLKYLDLSSNLLGGGLPQSIGNLHALTHLDISYNRFEVRLPSYLKNMTKLKTLLVTEGGDGLGPQPLPYWLRGMRDLRQVSFRLASRTGTIPKWFGELTHLELLDLDWNHITGTIPTELGNLTNLKYLMLNRNRMNGTIPEQVSGLPNLKMLMLDTNEFTGTLLNGQEDSNLRRCNAKRDDHRIPNMIADCGERQMDEDVSSTSNVPGMEVECPCCTQCCWDDALRCNMKDWIIEVEDEYRGSYNR